MAYHTALYLFLFLPAVCLIYQLVGVRFRPWILLAASLVFYWCISGALMIYPLVAVLLIHDVGIWMETAGREKEEKQRRGALVWGLASLLGILVWKKYGSFLAANGNRVLQLFGMGPFFSAVPVLLPIGISFYTLQAVGYLVDVWYKRIPAEREVGRLGLFLIFFPCIMEGPICRYGQTGLVLWEGRPITWENLTKGVQRILWGLAKKMVVADRLNILVQTVYGNYESYSGVVIGVAACCYTIQLYMEFSGCMDMVAGSGEIFGICLPENFRQPFFSKSVPEFWRRWHITLGAWFKDYMFYPVSMSSALRKFGRRLSGKGRYLARLGVSAGALFPVWLCNGLWHGPRWSFLFFGMYYFVLILLSIGVEPWVEKWKARIPIVGNSRVFAGFQILRTWVLVVIGELFFRAEGLKQGIGMFWSMIKGWQFSQLWDGSLMKLGLDRMDFLVVGAMIGAVVFVSILQERGKDVRQEVGRLPLPFRWGVYYGGLLGICVFGAYGEGYVPEKIDCQEVGVVFENRDRVVRLGRIVVFWGIFVFLLYGGSVVTAPKSNTAEAGMEGRDIPSAGVMAEPKGSLDVIVLGDSESHSAVSPMVLWKNHGITSFVCGQSGQRAVEAYYMLKQVLTVQRPKVVILETDLFYHSREWQREWNLAIERMARYYFPMVQYHNRWKGLTAGDWKGLPFEGRRDVNRGFLPSRDIRPYKGGPYMVKTEDREALRGAVTFWTDRLVELCRKEGIHLLLVGTPTPKNWDYRRHNGVSDYAAKKKLPFLDMNLLEKELNMDWDRDSRDEGDHLNTYGAEKVSRYLGDYLKANYGLTDHRKGEGAKRWWKDFERYEKTEGGGDSERLRCLS